MRFRCHPVRIIRYCLLIAGGLALVTGIWQYITGKSYSGN